jgi:hypothetical protein
MMQIYKKKWRKNSVRLLKFTLLYFISSIALTSCYKKQDTLLQVYVRDNSGATVAEAKVNLFAEPTDTSNSNTLAINLEQVTDENGIASFNLNEYYETGQTGVAILKVKATYYNKIGENIIKIIEEVNNECFIQIE